MSLVIGCYWSIGDVCGCDAFQIANQHPSAIAAFFSSVVWIKGHRHGAPRLRDLPNNEPPVCALASFLYTVPPNNYQQRLIIEDLRTEACSKLPDRRSPAIWSIRLSGFGVMTMSDFIHDNSCKLHSPWSLSMVYEWSDNNMNDMNVASSARLCCNGLRRARCPVEFGMSPKSGWTERLASFTTARRLQLASPHFKRHLLFCQRKLLVWFSAPSMKMEDSLGKYIIYE